MTIFSWPLYWHTLSAWHAPLALALAAIMLAGDLGRGWAEDRGWPGAGAELGETLEVRPGVWDTSWDDVGPRPLSGDPAGIPSGPTSVHVTAWEALPSGRRSC